MRNRFLVLFAIFLTLFSTGVLAEANVLDVYITEYVGEVIAYDQTSGTGIPDHLTESFGEAGEDRNGTSRTGVALYDITIRGYVNITNVETVGNLTLSSVNVTFNNTYNLTGMDVFYKPAYLTDLINISINRQNPNNPNNVSVFIPELRPGDYVTLNYTVSFGAGVGEPLNFTELYSFWRVMTGRTINVTLNVTNNFIRNTDIYDLVITKTPEGFTDVFGNDDYFAFSNLRGEDANNATISNSAGKTILEWNASDGTLVQNETRQIIFDIQAPVNLTSPDVNWSQYNDWGAWLRMGNVSSSFKLNGTVSGISLTNVEAVPTDLRFAINKERINESWYWNASVNLTNDANTAVDYNLTSLTIWATKQGEYADPGDSTTWIDGSNVTATYPYGFLNSQYTVNATWDLNLPWSQGVNFDNYSVLFNYSLVPIVWADASFIILDNGTQIFKLNESRSEKDGYLFVEEVYVLLGGYLMKVTKEVTPISAVGAKNRYLINVTLENVGVEQTPDLVTVFDMIPKDFKPRIGVNGSTDSVGWNMTNNTNVLDVTNKAGAWANVQTSDFVIGASDTGFISSGSYEGYWGYNIDFGALNATSDGDGVYDSGLSDKEIGIAYFIQGNSTLSKIENAYIVGVDPIRLEGANPSESVASRLRIASKTLEYLVVIGSLVVSIILLSLSFVYTRKK